VLASLCAVSAEVFELTTSDQVCYVDVDVDVAICQPLFRVV